MYMYTYMYICKQMYTCIYSHVSSLCAPSYTDSISSPDLRMDLKVCMYMHVYVYVYVCIYIYIYIHAYTDKSSYTFNELPIFANEQVCVYMYMYTYMYIYIHAYIHMSHFSVHLHVQIQ